MEVPRLRRARQVALLTQAELAERANITTGTVINLEQGKPGRISTIRKVAAALGVEPAELMEPSGGQPPISEEQNDDERRG